ncbi:hypothetical protein M427DRAFT_27274 [Gonapodya prolifera JEL478]|uniref:Uncharacterized protein n=1 Tax=Gonapodya prolifera (strain JEL478) TaxID=1344416 RepID=A0A139AYA1_GONPJ|nr:hypothetical protein M427DRAFT_27274 [Gonapodya prolifera JEL478]|eukprot:KXS21674.1 hypothetical protein M427DRAFT_27274 [Gonapodya prolifera JEL478]
MEGTHEADEDADAYWGPRFITQPHGYAEVERAQADLNARYRRQTGTGPHTPLSPSPRDRNIFEVNNPERRSVQSFSSPHGNGSPVTALQTLVNLKKQSFSLAPMEGSTSSDFARANGRPADSTSSVGHVSIPVPVGMASPFSFTFKPSTYFSPEEIDALVVKDPHQGVPTSPTIPPPTPVPAEASPRTPSNRRQSWRWLRWRQPQSDNEGENEGSGVELTPSHGVDTPNPSPNEPSHPQLTFIPLVVVLSTAQKNSQVNYVDITIGKDGHWVGKIARQKAVINDRVFVLQEVFGFSDGETAPADQQSK